MATTPKPSRTIAAEQVSRSRAERFGAGHVFVKAGDPFEGAFYQARGELSIYCEHDAATKYRGARLCLEAQIRQVKDGVWTASVVAEDPVVVVRLGYADLVRLLAETIDNRNGFARAVQSLEAEKHEADESADRAARTIREWEEKYLSLERMLMDLCRSGSFGKLVQSLSEENDGFAGRIETLETRVREAETQAATAEGELAEQNALLVAARMNLEEADKLIASLTKGLAATKTAGSAEEPPTILVVRPADEIPVAAPRGPLPTLTGVAPPSVGAPRPLADVDKRVDALLALPTDDVREEAAPRVTVSYEHGLRERFEEDAQRRCRTLRQRFLTTRSDLWNAKRDLCGELVALIGPAIEGVLRRVEDGLRVSSGTVGPTEAIALATELHAKAERIGRAAQTAQASLAAARHAEAHRALFERIAKRMELD